jgi:hypothetical protein
VTHPKVSLKPWQSHRVWRNQTASDQRRTITVYPCVETFPPGCQVTLFEAPDCAGGPERDGQIELGSKGDSVALVVRPGNAVFVRFDQGKSAVASVLADISQEP